MHRYTVELMTRVKKGGYSEIRFVFEDKYPASRMAELLIQGADLSIFSQFNVFCYIEEVADPPKLADPGPV